ncbi:MobC family replication-relaxation protein [Acinetobacter baumannii]|uniref:MobC family replication-relaxation protein n=1 Tax=Acinetobacter baumannii TaxID=470 RepID=UPI0035D0DFA6
MPDVSHFIHDKAEQKKRTEEKRQLILEFLAAETFSTSEIIGQLLELSRTAAYRTLKAMEREDLIKLYEIEYELAQRGKQTIWGLTPTGALLAADLDDFHVDYYEAGRIATSTIAHSIAVQRIKVVGLKKGWSEWQSGRKLRQLAAKYKKTWLQVPDSVALSPDNKRTAFEIERTVKTPKRYDAILSNYAEMFLEKTVDEVLYICPSNIAKRLEVLFSKINKIVIDGKDYPVHENVRKRFKFLSYEDWSKE